MNQGDIVGNLQFRADLMPACTIADQRGMSTRHNLRADLLQVLAHAFGIGSRYDDGCGAPQPVQEDPARLLSFGSAVAGSLSPYAGEDVIVEIRDRPECSQQLASFPTGRGAAPARRSTLDSVLLSIGCSTGSRASSPPPNGPRSPNAHRTPRCATSTISSNAAFGPGAWPGSKHQLFAGGRRRSWNRLSSGADAQPSSTCSLSEVGVASRVLQFRVIIHYSDSAAVTNELLSLRTSIVSYRLTGRHFDIGAAAEKPHPAGAITGP